MRRAQTVGSYLSIPTAPHFTFSAHLFCRGSGREHAEEGRTSLSSASDRGIRLRLQAEPGRGGWLSEARRCTAIFNRTALVGLWGDAATSGEKGMQRARAMWTNRWRKAEVRQGGVEVERRMIRHDDITNSEANPGLDTMTLSWPEEEG